MGRLIDPSNGFFFRNRAFLTHHIGGHALLVIEAVTSYAIFTAQATVEINGQNIGVIPRWPRAAQVRFHTLQFSSRMAS
jgi:hypothetical protein